MEFTLGKRTRNALLHPTGFLNRGCISVLFRALGAFLALSATGTVFPFETPSEESPKNSAGLVHFVQVGAYSKAVYLREMAEKLERQGYDKLQERVIDLPSGEATRLLVGPYPERRAAVQTASGLRGLGFECFILSECRLVSTSAGRLISGIGPRLKYLAGPQAAPPPAETETEKEGDNEGTVNAEASQALILFGKERESEGTSSPQVHFVQVGAYSKAVYLREMAERLERLGYVKLKKERVSLSCGLVTRLLVGPYERRGTAAQATSELRRLGLECFIVSESEPCSPPVGPETSDFVPPVKDLAMPRVEAFRGEDPIHLLERLEVEVMEGAARAGSSWAILPSAGEEALLNLFGGRFQRLGDADLKAIRP